MTFQEKVNMAKTFLLRASHELKIFPYLNEDRLKYLFDNSSKLVVEVDNNDPLYKGYFNDDMIYVNKDVGVETIVHEMLHFLSKNEDKEGVLYPLSIYCEEVLDINSKSDQEIDYMVEKIYSLNEAITAYITREIMGAIHRVDGYEGIADYLEMYINDNRDTLDKILTSYFMNDYDSVISIIEDFDGKFDTFLVALEKSRNKLKYIIREKIPTTKELMEYKLVIEQAASNSKKHL